TPTPPGAEPSDPALRGIVAAHNAVRATVTPAAATPIPNLNWSDTDAAVAKAWAAQCKFEHNAGRGNRGENIYASGGSGSSTPQKVVGSWASEKSNYNYANNRCSGVCGHYTQVVWAKTTTLGCAVQKCTGPGGPFGSGPWEFWVCDYSPPGNFNGQRPY
ncbi:MAG: Fis family transcriptional regulator, partial [Polyangiaceae bacterium]|nr:Fis family transcriptional regulator [Polyangiaceae bacterium]